MRAAGFKGEQETLFLDRFHEELNKEAGGGVKTKGGIDLDTTKMDMNIRKEGNGVEMTVDLALPGRQAGMIERVKRDGIQSLTPIIYSITPIMSIWPLVGLKSPEASLSSI